MTKKDFTKALSKPELTNPALAFISSATPSQEEPEKKESHKEPIKKTVKAEPKEKKENKPKKDDTTIKELVEFYNYKEKRSKQIALFLTPSTLDEITRLAKERGYSRNDFINTILEAFIKGAK